MTLRVGRCSHLMAKQAVGRWHYSRHVPGAFARYGAWESGVFVGAVLFGFGATPRIGSPFGVEQTECAELVRVALRDERTHPTSKIVAVAVRLFRREFPQIRVLMSFADPAKGHHGGIYQAMGWLYLGANPTPAFFRVNGRVCHPKGLHRRYGIGGQSIAWLRANVDPQAERVPVPPKHKYALPLDDEMRAKIAPLAQQYPTRAGSIGADAPSDQLGEGGAMPTPALPLDLFDDEAA